MDELIQHIVEKTGLSAELAHKALEILLSFVNREGDPAIVKPFLAKLPGAENMLRAHGEGGASGLLGGTHGILSGGGVLGAFSELTAAGIHMHQIQAVAQELAAFAKQEVGEDMTNQVIASLPGLSHIV